MDLEELKDSWQQLNAPPTPPVDFPSILKERGRAAGESVRKMKRSILSEALFLVLVYGFTIYKVNPYLKFHIGIMFAGTILLFGTYYTKKYLLLKSIENFDGSVDMYTFLAKKLHLLRRYMRFYWIVGYVFSLLALAYIVWLNWIYERARFYIVMGHTFRPGQEWIILTCWAVFIALLLLPIHFISKWLVDRFYGRHIHELEAILQEMS